MANYKLGYVTIDDKEKDFIEDLNKSLEMIRQIQEITKSLPVDILTFLEFLNTEELVKRDRSDGYDEYWFIGLNKRGVIAMPKAYPYGDCEETLPFDEYGITWARTKEELFGVAK